MKKFTSINFSPPFDAVKSSTSNLTKLDPLCPLSIPFVKKISVYSVLNSPKTFTQSLSFHFSQDRRSLNISSNPHHFPLISQLLNGKSPSIFIPTFHFHSLVIFKFPPKKNLTQLDPSVPSINSIRSKNLRVLCVKFLINLNTIAILTLLP